MIAPEDDWRSPWRCFCPRTMDPDADDFYDDCAIHVPCDAKCGALVSPVTLEDYQLALEHARSHRYMSGCSHGC